MDTRSRKWTNKVLITLVMIAMTLSGIYGLDTIHNMAVTGDNSFSLDEQDQSDYIKNTQMSLFDKWADQEGDKVYYTQANHVSESLLNKIKKESFVKVTMKVKPYDKKMVIENLSFKLERGKTYAFVGETGCGKSTIVNLLFRLWDTKSGNIMIDGENIKEYNLFSLRKQLSIATQNVYIKDDSIENNILMGRKKEDCAYDEICKLVGMESILSKFPKEKDVSVGENGNKLSGGQKQRIAMARALVHADNVLILDEATSALDNITQNEIMKNIKPLYQDKIVIIITHRLDTISDVDKIFVMSEGRICEEGQHNELMKKGEKYYALVQNL